MLNNVIIFCGVALVIAIFVIVSCVVLVRYIRKKYDILKEFKLSTINYNSIVAQMYTFQQACNIDSMPHDVLCIGNSITLHPPFDDVNWNSNCGMAASRPDCDYCHVLEKMMRKHNVKTSVTAINIAMWERDLSIDVNTLLSSKCIGKDIIIIRLGENVLPSNFDIFDKALSRLIEYCMQYTKKILITGLYWPNMKIELAIVKNAMRYNLKYIPLFWIWNLYREECSPKEGDLILDVAGNVYPIKGDFILTHPNDNGMKLIANSIYKAL